MRTEDRKVRLFREEPSSIAKIVAIAAAAILVGIGLVYEPMLTMAVACIVAGTAVAYVWRPVAVLTYFVFVVFQDLVLNFFRDSPDWFPIVKRLDELALLVLLTVTLMCHRTEAFRPVRSAYLALVGTILIGLIATLIYTTEYLLASYDVFLLYKGFVVFYVVSQLNLESRDINRSMNLLLVLGGVCLVASLLDLSLGPAYRELLHHPRPVEYRMGLPTVVGLFEHPGLAGWFFAFCACVALAYWIVRRTPFHLFLTFAFTAGSMLSLRRKPIIGLLAAFVLAVFLATERRSTLRTTLAVCLLIACVAFAAGDIVIEVFQDLLSVYVFAPDPMNVARNSMHLASIKIAMDRFPLGAGFGLFGGKIAATHYSPLNYEYGLSRVPGLMEGRAVYMMDVFWPHVLGELGFIGLALFVLALFLLVAPILTGIDTAVQSRAIVTYAAVFVFSEALFESFGWAVFDNTLAGSLIFGFLAMAWISRSMDTPDQSRSAASPSRS